MAKITHPPPAHGSGEESNPNGLGADAANAGRGRDRGIVGRSPQQIAREHHVIQTPSAQPPAKAASPDLGRDEPAGSTADEGQTANGYAGRIDREDPSTGLGGHQSGMRQSHDRPGVGRQSAAPR